MEKGGANSRPRPKTLAEKTLSHYVIASVTAVQRANYNRKNTRRGDVFFTYYPDDVDCN